MSFFMSGLIRSSVRVELDVRTSDERVDMEAENTSTTTIPIRISGSVESIVGTMLSNATLVVPSSAAMIIPSYSPKRRPNPPRK